MLLVGPAAVVAELRGSRTRWKARNSDAEAHTASPADAQPCRGSRQG